MQSKIIHRKFGIEFEHISTLQRSDLSSRLAAAKIPMSSGHGDYSGWQIKSDGSITPMGKFGVPVEIATPPMMINQFTHLTEALKIVSQYGAVNSSCGLHVHVSAPDLSGVLFGQYANADWQNYVTKTWTAIEKTMYTYVPPSRRGNHYCRPGVQWANKYQAINLSSLNSSRRTVEFRLHNSTLNSLKAFSFAVLCQAIIDTMAKKKEIKTISPIAKYNTEPKRIRTKAGGDFTIQREKSGKWLIEAKHFKSEVNALDEAFKEFKKQLGLAGENYLEAFHYPYYGNAMTEICDWTGINGLFRGYVEDRYERMLTKHGPADGRQQQDTLLPDEQDFYHEPDLEEPRASQVPNDNMIEQMHTMAATSGSVDLTPSAAGITTARPRNDTARQRSR